jgi:secondary thiamine-phosphate synthase enzyme
MVYSDTFAFESQGVFFTLNITEQIRSRIQASGIKQGIVLVFYQHTTGGIIIIEHEAGFLVDLEDMLERLVPAEAVYAHHLRDYDHNGAAHVRNALIPPSVSLPVISGDLALGEYQDILVVDMQPELKKRFILIQVVGE